MTSLWVNAQPDRPRAFGYKCQWLAMKATSADEVFAALLAIGAAKRPVPCNWESGLRRVYGAVGTREIFITPPVNGWCFVVDRPMGLHRSLEVIARLGRKWARPLYGFGSHRGVDHACWIALEPDKAKRAWCRSGGRIVYDLGDVTPAERALDLSFAEEREHVDDERWERSCHESTVIALARAWSLDPTTLDEVTQVGVGVLARLV